MVVWLAQQYCQASHLQAPRQRIARWPGLPGFKCCLETRDDLSGTVASAAEISGSSGKTHGTLSRSEWWYSIYSQQSWSKNSVTHSAHIQDIYDILHTHMTHSAAQGLKSTSVQCLHTHLGRKWVRRVSNHTFSYDFSFHIPKPPS